MKFIQNISRMTWLISTAWLLLCLGSASARDAADGSFPNAAMRWSASEPDAGPVRRDAVRPHLTPVFSEEAFDSAEAGGAFLNGDVSFRLGRQPYSLGNGYAWKPSDLLREGPLDPARTLNETDGAYMSYAFGGGHEIGALYQMNMEEADAYGESVQVEDGKYQIKMQTRQKVWDLAIHYTEAKKNRTDFEGASSGLVSEDAATIPVKWRLLSAGVRGKFGAVGVHAEGGHAWLDLDSAPRPAEEEIFAQDHSMFLVGVDYMFENEIYLVLEYYQEGLGKDSPDAYTLNDRWAYLTGERNTIGRDNVFLGARIPLTDIISFELYNIINANDPSVVVNPWLVLSADEDVTVSFSVQVPVGDEETSAGQLKPSAFGRIQLNF